MKMTPQTRPLKAEELIRIRYGSEWFENVSNEDAARFHKRNVRRLKEAQAWHDEKDRVLHILAVYGSGRSSFRSCAHELSNSQLLLRGALEPYRDSKEYQVEEVALREYNVEPCNKCVATCSALCNMPCSCFPLDQMQDLYPLVLKCDVMLLATGVYMGMPSGRLANFLQRLISLDGGFFLDEDQWPENGKDQDFRDRALKLSIDLSEAGKLPYDARMWGRVAAHFITSKDEKNDIETAAINYEEKLSFIELVAHALRTACADFGFFHADPWYVGAWSKHNEEYAFDKRWFASHPEFRKKAGAVVRAAVALGEKHRKNPPPFDGGGRENRT